MMKRLSTLKKKSIVSFESLETRCVLAALFPAYVDGQLTLGSPTASSPYGLENTFLLASRPTASKTIYLDFDGHHSVDNRWGHDIVFPAFDRNGNNTAFADSELLEIQQQFQNAAEDFAPFDVNVTTIEPPASDLIRTGSSDSRYGIRSVQTQATGGFGDGIGGVAYLNSFDDNADNPVFVFNKGANNGGMTISHEVGHGLGLSHDGLNGATYHPGTSSGLTSWGPIMGAPFGKTVTQWSIGDYAGSTTTQDDLAIITSSANGFGYRPDDHGNTFATATALASSTTVNQWGIIQRNTDVDIFRFTTGGGNVLLNVTPFAQAPNLDAEIKLYDSFGALIASADPLSTTAASISTTVPAGEYFLQVDGVGRIDRYSDYGSIGYFSITATYSPFTNSGDFNTDGVLNTADIDLLTTSIAGGGTNSALFDMDGDGIVGLSDRDEWLGVAGAANLSSGVPYLLGDANLDGAVDVSDLNIWNSHNTLADARWSSGDFNASGTVSLDDFALWNTNKFQSGTLASNLPANLLSTHTDPDIKSYDEGEFFNFGDHDDHNDQHEKVDNNVALRRSEQLSAGPSVKLNTLRPVANRLQARDAVFANLSQEQATGIVNSHAEVAKPSVAANSPSEVVRTSRTSARAVRTGEATLETQWKSLG